MNLSTVILFKNLHYDRNTEITLEGDLLVKYQKIVLRIAEDIISLCEREKIWYQLGGGTALGAIRHHGFIPWDDDMDLIMLKKDFLAFVEQFNICYGEKYSVQKYDTPAYCLPMARIRLKGSVYRGREDIHSDDCGFFVDIFPLENVFDNVFLRYLHGIACYMAGGILSCRKFYQDRKFLREVAEENPNAKSTILTKIRLGWLVSFLSLRRWAIITNAVYGLCKNDHSKYVSIPSGRKHYFGEMYLREGMVNTIAVPFEGHMWQVAKDYDAYFTALYGPDYMTPPPEEEREHHIVLELKFPDEEGDHAESDESELR